MDKKRRIRLVLFEEHKLILDALRCLLQTQADFTVVGATTDPYETVQLARRLEPRVALVGVNGQVNRLELIRDLAETPAAILVAAPSMQREESLAALQFGTRGVVLKTGSADLLFKSIRSVADGQYWIDRHAVGDLVETIRRLRASADPDARKQRFGLTRRETEIIAAIVAGETNRAIAERFSLSEDTVKHHLTHIFNKVGVFTRLELALFALHHHLVAADDTSVPTT